MQSCFKENEHRQSILWYLLQWKSPATTSPADQINQRVCSNRHRKLRTTQQTCRSLGRWPAWAHLSSQNWPKRQTLCSLSGDFQMIPTSICDQCQCHSTWVMVEMSEANGWWLTRETTVKQMWNQGSNTELHCCRREVFRYLSSFDFLHLCDATGLTVNCSVENWSIFKARNIWGKWHISCSDEAHIVTRHASHFACARNSMPCMYSWYIIRIYICIYSVY